MAATTGPFRDSVPVMSTVDVRPSAVLLLMKLLVLSGLLIGSLASPLRRLTCCARLAEFVVRLAKEDSRRFSRLDTLPG